MYSWTNNTIISSLKVNNKNVAKYALTDVLSFIIVLSVRMYL